MRVRVLDQHLIASFDAELILQNVFNMNFSSHFGVINCSLYYLHEIVSVHNQRPFSAKDHGSEAASVTLVSTCWIMVKNKRGSTVTLLAMVLKMSWAIRS